MAAARGHPQFPHWPLSRTSVTERIPFDAEGDRPVPDFPRPFPADAGLRAAGFARTAPGFGVIATSTSSRHDTSPHDVQRKCGWSSP
jgi:hypothetical protein